MRTIGAIRSEVEASLLDAGYKPAERKPSKAKPEERVHLAVASYLRQAIAHEGYASRHGVSWCSEDLASFGKKTRTKNGDMIDIGAIKRKARGCIPGRPDIEILYQGRAFRIELKAATGHLTPSQIAYHSTLKACGVPVAVCKSIDDVERACRRWGIPISATAGPS